MHGPIGLVFASGALGALNPDAATPGPVEFSWYSGGESDAKDDYFRPVASGSVRAVIGAEYTARAERCPVTVMSLTVCSASASVAAAANDDDAVSPGGGSAVRTGDCDETLVPLAHAARLPHLGMPAHTLDVTGRCGYRA